MDIRILSASPILDRLKVLLSKFRSPRDSISPGHERIQVSGSLIKLATRYEDSRLNKAAFAVCLVRYIRRTMSQPCIKSWDT